MNKETKLEGSTLLTQDRKSFTLLNWESAFEDFDRLRKNGLEGFTKEEFSIIERFFKEVIDMYIRRDSLINEAIKK